MLELCNWCEGSCLFKKQLEDLHERSGLSTIPPGKPGLDPESYSIAQAGQERIIKDARSKTCLFEARERIQELTKIEVLKGNKR